MSISLLINQLHKLIFGLCAQHAYAIAIGEWGCGGGVGLEVAACTVRITHGWGGAKAWDGEAMRTQAGEHRAMMAVPMGGRRGH